MRTENVPLFHFDVSKLEITLKVHQYTIQYIIILVLLSFYHI